MDEMLKDQEQVEISLVELAQELRRRWLPIAACVVLCVGAAALYAYATLAPVSYIYDARLRLPLNTGAWQINTCAEVLRGDIGADNSLTGVWQLKNSHVLVLRFSGPEGSVLKDKAAEYLPKAKAKVDELLIGQQKADFQRGTIRDLQRSVEILTASGSSPEIAARLTELEKLIEDKGASDAFFPPAQLVVPRNPVRIQPALNLGSNLVFAGLGGLILSCGFFICRYVYRKVRGA